ncbi:TPA: hypothetical protein VNE27_001180, partial [Streptococcus pyogenes]|nr:hypothetical protein [Streptococcus pyogenes]
EDELYKESIKCYQVEAYKAAYIFSYLANHKFIAKLAIDYSGVSSNFMSKCPDDEVRKSSWQKRVNSLKNEDEWEQTVNEKLIQAWEDDNVFKLPFKIKEKYSLMRVLRNNAAHAKDCRISESTVLELWNEIEYIYPYFVINGTIDAWMEDLEKLVRYSNSSIESQNQLQNKFGDFSTENKTLIVKKIIQKYLVDSEWDETYPDIVMNFLLYIFQESNYINQIGKDLTEKEELYLSIGTGIYHFQAEAIDIYSQFEESLSDYTFRYFCEEFSDNFWKFIDSMDSEVNKENLTATSLEILKKNSAILVNAEFNESRFLSDNSLFFKSVLDKIKHLYYYTMHHTGQRHHNTNTFDYSKFNSYIPYINYIFYRISSNPGLKEDEKVIDFVKRCNNLISSDYSAESWYSERQMQDVIKKINEKYTILEDSGRESD